MPRLFEQLRIAHGDGSDSRLMSQLAKTDLLILDDWGLQKIHAPQRSDLMEVIEDRRGLKSTLITSQLPIDQHTTPSAKPPLTVCCTARTDYHSKENP